MVTALKLRIRKGDTVRVLRGKDRGSKGKVLRAFPQSGRLLVEGIQLVTKHTRPRRQGEKSQRVQVPSSVPVANVQLVCPQCAKGTRVAIRRDGDERLRVCKKCQAPLS
jgi:large subunit ribosomal protein L24